MQALGVIGLDGATTTAPPQEDAGPTKEAAGQRRSSARVELGIVARRERDAGGLSR